MYTRPFLYILVSSAYFNIYVTVPDSTTCAQFFCSHGEKWVTAPRALNLSSHRRVRLCGRRATYPLSMFLLEGRLTWIRLAVRSLCVLLALCMNAAVFCRILCAQLLLVLLLPPSLASTIRMWPSLIDLRIRLCRHCFRARVLLSALLQTMISLLSSRMVCMLAALDRLASARARRVRHWGGCGLLNSLLNLTRGRRLPRPRPRLRCITVMMHVHVHYAVCMMLLHN